MVQVKTRDVFVQLALKPKFGRNDEGGGRTPEHSGVEQT